MNSKPTDHPQGRRRPVPWPAVVLAIGILLASASTSRAALVLDISSTSMQPSGSAIISVYASAFDINTPDEVANFQLTLGIERAQSTSLLNFTADTGDEDLSGRADYIFFARGTSPSQYVSAGNPQETSRSDFVVDLVNDTPALISDTPVLLGQFTVQAAPFAIPSLDDVFTITVDPASNFSDVDFNVVPIHSISGGRIQISAVPEPSSLLGLSGLMGGWVLARRRRRASR